MAQAILPQAFFVLRFLEVLTKYYFAFWTLRENGRTSDGCHDDAISQRRTPNGCELCAVHGLQQRNVHSRNRSSNSHRVSLGPRQEQPPSGVRQVEKKPEGAEHVPLHPNETVSRARVRVAQLETAMKALDADDPALPAHQEAAKKAQSQAKVPSIESRLKVAEEYVDSRNESPTGGGADFGSGSRRTRLFPSQSDRGGEESDQVAGGTAEDAATGRLRTQAVGMSVAFDRGCAWLREDFKPVCNEEVVQWMRDWQANMHDATLTGNAHELTRFCRSAQ